MNSVQRSLGTMGPRLRTPDLEGIFKENHWMQFSLSFKGSLWRGFFSSFPSPQHWLAILSWVYPSEILMHIGLWLLSLSLSLLDFYFEISKLHVSCMNHAESSHIFFIWMQQFLTFDICFISSSSFPPSLFTLLSVYV